MLNLHKMTDFYVQLNVNKVNIRKPINIARSYQRRRRGDKKAMADTIRLL